MIIDKEKEKITKPLSELKISDLERKPLMEYFITDEKLLQEHRDLHKPYKQRFKFTVFWDLVWFMGILLYSRNIHYYAARFYPNRRKGLGNLVLISGIHCLVFMSTLVAGNFLVMGINPYTFLKKTKDLNKRIVEADAYKNLGMKDFMLLYADIEELEEKKSELKKQLEASKNKGI